MRRCYCVLREKKKGYFLAKNGYFGPRAQSRGYFLRDLGLKLIPYIILYIAANAVDELTCVIEIA